MFFNAKGIQLSQAKIPTNVRFSVNLELLGNFLTYINFWFPWKHVVRGRQSILRA